MRVAQGDQFSRPSKSTYKPVSSWLFPHPIAWIACAILIVVEIVWIELAGFTFSLGDTWKQFLFAALLFVSGMRFSQQGLHRWSILAFTTAFFIIFGKVSHIANYLSHGLGFPWADSGLAQLEQAMGFDWFAYLAWVNSHPKFIGFLQLPYEYLQLFTVFTVICLLSLNMLERLREFVAVFAISLAITITIGAMFPAGGTYHFYQPAAELHSNIPARSGRFFLEHLLAVHDGTMKAVQLDRMVGLITFPSFHMVMAMLTLWATRGTAGHSIFAGFTLLMVLAIPVFGGHYFPDLIAGVGVVVFSIWIYRQWSGYRGNAPETDWNMLVLQNESASRK